MAVYSPSEIDLSGEWQIVFDPETEGLKESWHAGSWPQGRSLPVQVPGIWNLSYPDAEGIGFYRSSFEVPEDWQDRAVLLNFQGVMYRCDVWLNGEYLGSHEGGFTPFSLEAHAHLYPGQENVLVVRVAGLSKEKAVDGLVLQHCPASKQSWYYVYAGIWGKVALEARAWAAREAAWVDPDLQNERAQLHVRLCNRRSAPQPVDLELSVVDPHGTVCRQIRESRVLLPGTAQLTYPIQLPQPFPWSPDQPDLYRLEVQIAGEAGEVDRRQVTFGMRDFTMRNGEFLLNGEPIFLRAILLQPNYPVTLVCHPDLEMAEREIRLAKEAGFNLIRIHIHPVSPGFLDLADRMGVLIYAESSLAWIRNSPRIQEHGRREVKELIERDRNHPSVVIWGIYNENPPAMAINGAELAHWARAIDPTRVIVENSGGSLAIDQDFGWTDRAYILPNRQSQHEKILDLHTYLGALIPGNVYSWLQDLGKGASSLVLVEEAIGKAPVLEAYDREAREYSGKIFVSELGCGGMADLNEVVAGFGGREDLLDSRELKTLRDSLRQGFSERRLDRVFGTMATLARQAQDLQAAGNTQQIEALLTNPRISGYLITQLNDVSWEFHAGLLDLWRNPKPAYFASQRLNRPHLLVLRPEREAAGTGDAVSVQLTLVNQAPLAAGAEIHTVIVAPDGSELARRSERAPVKAGIHPLPVMLLAVGPEAGDYCVKARLLDGENLLAEAVEPVLGLEPVDWECLSCRPQVLGEGLDQTAFPFSVTESAYPLSGAPSRVPSRGGNGAAVLPIVLAPRPGMLKLKDWEDLFSTVEAGGRAIIGALRPEDGSALAALEEYGHPLVLHPSIGSWMGCYHWIPPSAVFAGLPNGCLAAKPYIEIQPKYALTEQGGEVLAGSFRNTQSRVEAPAMLWYSDIEQVRHGRGSVLFCQYRAFTRLEHPAAARLAYNLLEYANHREP